jgi:hypothetical protein
MSPKDNNKQVSAAVRILQQKRDASARATHLMVKNDSLITYEKEFEGQAVIKKFFIATFLERKIMSTKTITKRIALVAASALALGGFSVISAPQASAAVVQVTATKVTSINLKASTTSPTAGVAMAVQVGATVAAQAYINEADNFAIKWAGALTSYPSGGFSAVAPAVNAGALATELTDTTADGSGRLSTAVSGSQLVSSSGAAKGLAAATVTATATSGIGKFTFTPSVAGTYVITVWNENNTDGIINPGETQQTISITVAAASTFATGTSSAYLIDGNGTNVGTPTTDALGASGSKTMSTANVAAITVSLKDANNVAMTSGNTITATISGSGGVGGSTADAPQAGQCSATTIVRSVSVSADAVNTVYVCADGTAGTGTVTISVTNAAGVTATLATKTVTFYGTITKLEVVSTPMSILRAGGFQAGAITALDGLTATTTPAVVLKATDSGGNLVQGLSTIAGVPASTSVIASTTVGEDTVANDADSTYGGPGYYVAHVTSATSAVSGNTTTVTYRIIDPAGDGTTYLTAVATFTVGGSVASETLSFDKTSYIPGEAIVLTRTAKDSAGNPVYDGAASPAVTFNKAVGGTAPAASFYVGGKKATSATTPTLFAPAVSGDFTAQATSSATGTPTITAAATVEGDADASLALDAANAATDAANNAYDEAQNATQAASDALAAVTALAKQVKSLIASVKKLTKAVAKLS